MTHRFHCFLILAIVALSSLPAHAQWVRTIGDTTISSLAVSGTNLLAGTDMEPIRIGGCDVLLSANSGMIWNSATISSGGVTGSCFAVNQNMVFIGTTGGYYTWNNVYVSTNNGTSWYPSPLSRMVYALVLSGSNLFAGSWNGEVYLSTDSGTSWSTLSIGQTNRNVYALVASGMNLFAGTGGGGVFLSTNNGVSWTQVNNGLTRLDIRSFALNGSNLFAGTYGGGVFLSTNNGTSWTASNSGLSNSTVWSLAVSGTDIFAGTGGGGVFVSTNNGTNWTPVNSGLTSTHVLALAASSTYLFAGTLFDGVWRRPLSELVSVEREQPTLPAYFCLGQNYPNPFNPSTIINYQVATRSQVTLKVFDVMGREVASLVNDFHEPGYKAVRWSASKLTGGVYFYQLRAGAFVETRRMLLIK